MLATKKKLGNQTPTQSVILPYKTSDYELAISLYEKSGRTSQEWQTSLMKGILALNEDGLWTHTKFGYAVPRRNGKNEIVIMREIYALEKGHRALHTAHRTSTSHSAWEKLVSILESAGYENGEDFTTLKAMGRERVEFKATGGRVEFRTRTSTGGLGEGFDLLIIDEAQEYTDDQESALKYIVTDSDNPQTLFCGTPPTLVSSGTVFTEMRTRTLQGNMKNAGWAEWSVEDQSDCYDVDLWYLTNPSLGTIFTERSIEDEIGSDEIDFNIQRLGLWLKYNQKSAITEQDWERLKVTNIPKFDGKLHVGIKFGNDGENTALSIAVKTNTGKVFVEVYDCQPTRAGTQWIVNFLKQADVQSIVIDGAGGQNLLAAELKDYRVKTTPILPTVKEVITANAKWDQAVFQEQICHNNQPSLTQVVTNCEKRLIGTQGGFGYKSQYEDRDIILMDSAIFAYWSCTESKQYKKQKVWY